MLIATLFQVKIMKAISYLKYKIWVMEIINAATFTGNVTEVQCEVFEKLSRVVLSKLL